MNHAFVALLLCCALVVPARGVSGERVLTSFESEAETRGWSGGEVVTRHASQGKQAYQILPGVTAEVKLEGDWSAYRHLKMDAFNPGEVIMVNFRFWDNRERFIMAFEYNLYHGRTTQHISIPGLTNNFGLGEGIDTTQMARVQIVVSKRRQHDTSTEGIYLDNVRLSADPTEPYLELPDGSSATDPLMKKPAGFLLPEFPGFEAGYHTFAIDPANYQLLTLPGTGRDGKGRALEMKPLGVDGIKIWERPCCVPNLDAVNP
ncbi:MAG: hypothetical protein KAX80_11120, partial [Planctomycetes bacterium]|nr:hypothetical protein [Planctomycetota bacterium]